VYESVIKKEREGRYAGNTVQVIPHITNEIQSRILAVANEDPKTDIVIVEIGGTVGDIESIPFLETARQLIHEQARGDTLSIHLTLIPEVAGKGSELKTKPTQHSVKAMQEMGIQPDILICRAPLMMDDEMQRKIAQFTNVDLEAIFTSYNVPATIYELPLILHDQKLDLVVLKKLGIEPKNSNLKAWKSVMDQYHSRKGKVRIGFVGKFVDAHDAYKSIEEALFHASLACGTEVEIVKVSASKIERESIDDLLGENAEGGKVDGVLVPNSDGQSGVIGMMKAAEWARKNKVPFFGISLGMQIMVMEWARNILQWSDADSSEFNYESTHNVICRLSEQTDVKSYGVTTRLGKSDSTLLEGTRIFATYGKDKIAERHRHEFEVSNKYRQDILSSGLVISALTPDESLVDSVEWPDHPWGVGVQFNPEFKSKPNAAHPLFRDFIAAAKNKAGI
jgi:CTP synthase